MRCAPVAATADAVLLAVPALRVQGRAGARQSPPWKGRIGRPETEKPMKPTLILFLSLLAGPALAGSHQAPLDVQARVVDALADDMRAAEESDGVPAHLEFQMVDLNGDGRPAGSHRTTPASLPLRQPGLRDVRLRPDQPAA